MTHHAHTAAEVRVDIAVTISRTVTVRTNEYDDHRVDHPASSGNDILISESALVNAVREQVGIDFDGWDIDNAEVYDYEVVGLIADRF